MMITVLIKIQITKKLLFCCCKITENLSEMHTSPLLLANNYYLFIFLKLGNATNTLGVTDFESLFFSTTKYNF